MLKLVLAAIFCVQAFARPSIDYPIESHIVGGSPAKEGQFPFIVSLRDTDDKVQFCGGSLLSDRYVLTAAHCVEGKKPNSLVIGAGSVNLTLQKIYKADKIIIHPHSIPGVYDDIALVRVSSPIPSESNVQTILPYPNNDQLEGKKVTGMGWGLTSVSEPGSEILLYLKNLSVVANDVCQKLLGPDRKITPGKICAGGVKNEGMCYGDSGSPLIHSETDGKTYVVGIVSWGVPCAKGYPDVFTRVSYYNKWIKQNMK